MPYRINNIRTPSVMSFYPNVRGVGFAYFQSQQSFHYAGMITTRNRFSNRAYMLRIKELINTLQPKVIILEEYRKSKGSVKKERITKLIKEIAVYSKKQGIEVVLYKRSDIRSVFSLFNVRNKYNIAELLCAWIPFLKYYMYKPRSSGRMEPYSSAVFEAVSLCVTWFYLKG